MATTTNYGWETPDDTDLVKDGAAAIRTLGNSVDTTTKALNPETTLGDLAYRSATSNTNTRLAIGSAGQVLTVASGVPSWASPSDQTPLTTKGDLFTFTTVDARIGVGANGTVLTADSAEASGIKWAAPAAGSFVGASIYNTASFSISNNTATRITMNSEFFDSSAFHDTINTARITIPAGKAGKYLVCMGGAYEANGTGVRAIFVYKNGASFVELCNDTGVTGGVQTPRGSVIIELAVNDYIELFTQQSSGTTLTFYAREYEHPFQVQYLGA